VLYLVSSMKSGRWPLFLLIAFLTLGAVSLAQFDFGGNSSPTDPSSLVAASLIPDTTAISPGKEFTVGVMLKLKPGYRTYWQFPGEAGTAPKIRWELPEGFSAGPISWPIPEQEDDAGLVGYVYHGEVLLPVRITVPAQLPEKVVLKAEIKWQACNDQTCIPGNSSAQLELPGGDAQPANADVLSAWNAKLPKSGAPFKVAWDVQSADHFALKVSGIPADAKVEFFPLPVENAKPGVAKIDAPATDGSRLITVPIANDGAPNLPWSGVIVTQASGKAREGWQVSARDAAPSPAAAVQAPSVTKAPVVTAPALVKAPAGQDKSLFVILATAFLGGLILNIMPCVLPVIALKIFGFVKQAGEEPKRVFQLGLAFVAGVFVFFLGIATLVVALHSAGSGFNWGLQFQNPYLFSALIAVVFVFGLSLLGVFEITLSSGATTTLSTLSGREGYGGAFVHGLFTTFLGTSCTAPFLATSLFYATTQKPIVVYAIFTFIAMGMSLPYFLLTARPAWMRFLPKPGMWMERAKQITGFIMLAVAVWLLGIFAVSRPESSAGLIHYLLALGVACWVLGAIRNRTVALAMALIIAISGYFLLLQAPLRVEPRSHAVAESSNPNDIAWQPFSEEKVANGIQSGQPVFIDFTAEWCINCKVFEKTVLDTPAVRSAFRDKKVLALRADWTNQDEKIAQWLKSFGRIGVPLYVLYRPGESQPVVFDAITQSVVLGELAKIKGPTYSVATSH